MKYNEEDIKNIFGESKNKSKNEGTSKDKVTFKIIDKNGEKTVFLSLSGLPGKKEFTGSEANELIAIIKAGGNLLPIWGK